VASAARPCGTLIAVHISARGDYAVRAAVALAVTYPRTVSAQVLAAEQGMPRKFLETILADLRRAGLVRTRRGVQGGYTLARPADDVTIGDVVRAVDGPLAVVRGERPEQTRYEGVAEHLGTLWVALRAAVRSVLDEVTLSQLLTGDLPEHVTDLLARPEAWLSR
jgi:Rrf2 family protein